MLPEVNLLPKYERSESVLYNVFLIGLILIVLLSGLLIYFYFSTKGNLEEAENRVTALNEQKEILEARKNAAKGTETTSFRQVVSYVESHEIPTSILVDEYINLLPETGYLSNFSYTYNSVNITTEFDTIPAASTYIADLTNSPYLKEVVINNVNTFTHSSFEEEPEEDELSRYRAGYTMQVDHQTLLEEGDEE